MLHGHVTLGRGSTQMTAPSFIRCARLSDAHAREISFYGFSSLPVYTALWQSTRSDSRTYHSDRGVQWTKLSSILR